VSVLVWARFIPHSHSAVPTSNLSEQNSVIRNFNNIISIEEKLDLFNIYLIGANWKQLQIKLTPKCAQDMTEYLNGLEKNESWAIKSKLEFSNML